MELVVALKNDWIVGLETKPTVLKYARNIQRWVLLSYKLRFLCEEDSHIRK